MSMFGKHIWASELLGCCLLLCSFIATAAAGNAADETAVELRACRIVQRYGHARGGAETIGSLIELNMRQWKPQSSRGIEILGWRVEKIGAEVYRVTYEYKETGREKRVMAWRVSLTDFEIVPLTPLSARIQRMSLFL